MDFLITTWQQGGAKGALLFTFQARVYKRSVCHLRQPSGNNQLVPGTSLRRLQFCSILHTLHLPPLSTSSKPYHPTKMAPSNGLIVFLIVLGCLASVALLAAVLNPFRPEESLLRRNIPPEQAAYKPSSSSRHQRSQKNGKPFICGLSHCRQKWAHVFLF
jgi:hypothetical protein